MLKLNHSQVELDKQLILSIDNITLSYGQFNVLAGPSGAGKSTFLHLISGQLKATRGSIHWQDKGLDSLSDNDCSRWRNQEVGFIFQDFYLIPSLSALENVIPVLPTSIKILISFREEKNNALHLREPFRVILPLSSPMNLPLHWIRTMPNL